MAANQDTIDSIFRRFSLQGESDGESDQWTEPGTLRSQEICDEPDLQYIDLKFTGRCLGAGKFSKVYEATLQRPYRGHNVVAVKSILGDLNEAEIDILRKFKDIPHPYIIQFLAYIKNEREELIVTELAKLGSLYDFLSKDPQEIIVDFVVFKWLKCIASGLQFLHENNVIHRDIKSLNCLLCHGCVVKICDFGIARESNETMQTSHAKGTIRWMAPEMRQSRTFSKPSDVYSFGMVALEVCTRQVPFSGLNELQLWIREPDLYPEVPDSCPDCLKQLMFKCWTPEYNDRPTMQEILRLLEEENHRLDVDESEVTLWEEQHFPTDHQIQPLVSTSNEDRALREYAERETAVCTDNQPKAAVISKHHIDQAIEINTEDMYGPSPAPNNDVATEDKYGKAVIQNDVATEDMYGPGPYHNRPETGGVTTRPKTQYPEGEAKLFGVYGFQKSNTNPPKTTEWAIYSRASETSAAPEESPSPKNRKISEVIVKTAAPVENEVRLPKIKRRHPTSLEIPLDGSQKGELSNANCQLNQYMSHLQLTVSSNGFSATPVSTKGFAYMWAGAKATHGVTGGQVCFQVKVTEELDVSHMPDEEKHKNVVRVGWSTVDTSLNLGSDILSYGYGGTACKMHWQMPSDYGETYGVGDVITAYLDLTGKKPVISYAKNGRDLGVAFTVREDLEGRAFYPHVLMKNSAVEVNFGQNKDPLYPPKEGFHFIRNLPARHCVLGPRPPRAVEDCEVLMMIGLTGSGKTTWVKKHCKENPDKHYVVLGTNQIMDDMKITGLSRNYKERFDRLHEDAFHCYNELLDIARKRKHNYILDQTNLFPSARKRKMGPFEEYARQAVVVFPSRRDYSKRFKKQTVNDEKIIPQDGLNKMKAKFKLPDETEASHLFHEVIYTELQHDDAQDLLMEYKEEIAAL